MIAYSDDHEGLKAALKATFNGVAWNSCHCHLRRNAIAYVPKLHMRAAVAGEIRNIFNAPDREQAERLLDLAVARFRGSAARPADWMQNALPEGFTIFKLPQRQRRQLQTTNMLAGV